MMRRLLTAPAGPGAKLLAKCAAIACVLAASPFRACTSEDSSEVPFKQQSSL
jgi:hypothetical protein